MIHNIVIPWPNIDYDIDLNLKNVKADTIFFNVTFDGIYLSDYKIRAEVTDGGNTVDLANIGSGGSDDEIANVATDSGMSAFQVIVPSNETTSFLHYGWAEIEIEDTDGNKFTIFSQRLTFLEEK